MAFNFVQDFKIQIYDILSNCANIRSNVDRIYIGPVQDAKYPFLLINLNHVIDHSKFDNGIYSVEFEICIFIRDKVQSGLTLLLHEITQILVAPKFKLANYVVAGLRSGEVKFDQATDLISTKLSIKFKALIKEVKL